MTARARPYSVRFAGVSVSAVQDLISVICGGSMAVALISIALAGLAPAAWAADKTPLANYAGQVQPLQSGDAVPVAHGGTSAVTLTSHCVLLGAGTAAVHFACPSTSGYVLTDNGASSDPTFQAVAGVGYSVLINAQTGTSYTVVAGDQNKVITLSNASAVAVTLPQAGSAGFASGYSVTLRNLGFGLVTVTTTTSTIDGNGTQYYLGNAQSVQLISDGTNWQIVPTSGFYTTLGSSSLGVAYSLQFPDSTTKGGNARGFGATDLQTARTAAANVASGQHAFAAGYDNKASNSNSAALGESNVASAQDAMAFGEQNTVNGTAAFASGYFNTASGSYAAAFGDHNTASGQGSTALGHSDTASANYTAVCCYQSTASGVGSIVLGIDATDNSNLMSLIQSAYFGPRSGGVGSAQWRQHVFWNSTSGSSAVRLTVDGNSATTNNIANLPNNGVVAYTAECVIADKTTVKINTYSFGESLIWRGANAASTTVSTGNPTAAAGPTSTTGMTLQAVPTITADTTNGGFNLSFTPPSGNTDALYAVCRVSGTETILQ